MSSRASTPAVAGHAVVRLRNGYTYVGRAVYDGRSVTIDGALRVIVNGVVEHRPSRRRTVPFSAVREVLWDDDTQWDDQSPRTLRERR